MSIVDGLPNAPTKQQLLLDGLRSSNSPVYVFGAGVYAYVLVRYLKACGIRLEAIVVDREFKSSDMFMGLRVLSADQMSRQVVESNIVVGVTNYPLVVERLKQRGAMHVHVVDIPDYLNMPHSFMDKAFVEQHEEEFEQAHGSFHDDLSMQTYAALVKAKVGEDPDYLLPVVRLDHIYFPDAEFSVRNNESFLDVGGYTGDTLREFHTATNGNYARALSLEPSVANYRELEKTIAMIDPVRIRARKVGAWDKRTTLRFAAKEMHIDNQIVESGDEVIEVDTIDAIVNDAMFKVTLMKLDINGAEYSALRGATNTINRDQPRIIVRLHTKEDMYRIPLLLKQIAPNIKLFLRQRSYYSMMAILYAEF